MLKEDFTRFVLGALLHDIGKFKQRAKYEEDRGKTHSAIGYEWLSSQYGEGVIAAAARNHHGNVSETWESNLSLIIYEADNLAASERRRFDPSTDVDKSWHQEVLLASDFSRINLDSEAPDPRTEPKMRYWPLKALGGWTVPQEGDSGGSAGVYRELWEAFCNDFACLKAANRHTDVAIMLHLMERFTSYIPSITLHITGATDRDTFRKHPDVSLFDHARVTAASASCLYLFYYSRLQDRWDRDVFKDEITGGWEDSSQDPFLLVGGDLSGVQDFIYTISSRGALKALKGRSFFLELLTEHLVSNLLEELSLTRCNVLFTGGGHFYLLAPNTEHAKNHVESVRRSTNDYLWDAFNGALSCCIAYVPMGKAAFRDATRHWAALGQELETMKRRKWEKALDKVLGPAEMPHADCLTVRCEVCAREDTPLKSVRDVLMCPSCREQFLFGEGLQKAAREANKLLRAKVGIAVWDKKPQIEDDEVLAIGLGERQRFYKPFVIYDSHNSLPGTKWTYRLNDWDSSGYAAEGSLPLLAGIFHAGEFEDLESLVERGYGWDRAGVLRMDVDRLGKIFSSGLPPGDRTFSRMASLSRHFSLFFKYHLNGILHLDKKDGYENLVRTRVAESVRGRERLLSLVYSGGDDVFVIGHWLDVLEAAYDIEEAFSLMTYNPNITLSAGLVFAPPHHPVYRFAKDAGEAEAKAKKGGRNSLTAFGHTLRWQDAKDMRTMLVGEILPLLKKEQRALGTPVGSVSVGFLHRVLALVSPFVTRNEKKTDPASQFWLLPKVAYLTGRAAPSKEFLKASDEAKKAWMALKDRLLRQPDLQHLTKINGAVLWALMMMRKGGK